MARATQPDKAHNVPDTMSEEDILAARAAEERLIATIKAANLARSRFRKVLRGKGVKLVNWDAAKRMAELEKDEVKGDLRETFAYMRAFKALPAGTQAELFPTAEKPDPSKAYNDGFQKGVKGEGKRIPPPEFSSGDNGQQWLKGWDDGQKKISDNWFSQTDFAAMSDDDPVLARAPGGDDEEDEGDDDTEHQADKPADNVVPLKKDAPKEPDVKKAVANLAKAVGATPSTSKVEDVVKRAAAKKKGAKTPPKKK